MNEENKIWEDVSPTLNVDHFHDWIEMENLFGELGEPGLSQVTKVLSQPDNIRNITFTLYRGESGQLLGVHGFYTEDNVQKPFILIVHPDHLRIGIATKIANFVTNQFVETKEREFDYEKSWRDIPVSESAASFMNKYAKKQYDITNNTESSGQ